MPCWFDLCWQCEHQVTQIFHCSTSDHESTIRIDLRVTDKFQQVGKFANMKSANNEKQLYILSRSLQKDHYKTRSLQPRSLQKTETNLSTSSPKYIVPHIFHCQTAHTIT